MRLLGKSRDNETFDGLYPGLTAQILFSSQLTFHFSHNQCIYSHFLFSLLVFLLWPLIIARNLQWVGITLTPTNWEYIKRINTHNVTGVKAEKLKMEL